MSNKDRLLFEMRVLKSYDEELKFKLQLIERDLSELQENLDFNQKYLETCVVPFPDLDSDKKQLSFTKNSSWTRNQTRVLERLD